MIRNRWSENGLSQKEAGKISHYGEFIIENLYVTVSMMFQIRLGLGELPEESAGSLLASGIVLRTPRNRQRRPTGI